MDAYLINHHLYQDGDTYGLIYALILSKRLRVRPAVSGKSTETPMFALFFVNGSESDSNTAYRDKILRRLAAFNSFGLETGRTVKIVRCVFDDQPRVAISCDVPDGILITANARAFRSNPR